MNSGNRSRFLWSWVGAVVAALLLVGTVGCGGGGPYDMVPVSGKVTYEDGSLISGERILIEFHPRVKAVDKKTHARPAVAEVNVADGTFSEATTIEPGDGVIVGKHEVEVVVTDADGQETRLQVTPSEVEIGAGSDSLVFKAKKA